MRQATLVAGFPALIVDIAATATHDKERATSQHNEGRFIG
jgi:hypothetical protein